MSSEEIPVSVEEQAFLVLFGIEFGFLDVVILAGLIVAAVYWLFVRNNKQEDAAEAFKSYTIQYVYILTLPVFLKFWFHAFADDIEVENCF